MSDDGLGTRRRTRRNLCLVLIGVLYVVSVPWYREPGDAPDVWLGLPDWVAISVLCYVGVAILNAFAWLATDVRDEPEAKDAPSRTEGPS